MLRLDLRPQASNGDHLTITSQTSMAQTRASSSTNPAVVNAVLVGAALLWGAALLIQRGRLTWPPYQLLSSLSTLAGCLALVGPVILADRASLRGAWAS